ncbi:hypothetical protein M409DRAFT_64199 [Zasmidium cellare ATCC 36951]|uniref:NmrA-like domain-containing protein n=1 Tax=Zasmidium cellare ATCC 36951 TaxID=1080233 RepID=A0A6A6CXE6_ZASCE|nr:uncharacterized protein M409DRAFT_64199 [Zasmidium cellare ATCC 36951]KAF2170469.1 hypothetical protein M409DRAFT_64199 [Zasmidium cellare ATCC 36951]
MSQEANGQHLLVVLGATGNQGKAVLRRYTESQLNPGMRLRGVTRNTESSTAKELQDLGIEMVCADLDDLPSLKAAFTGATHIFATTDSNRLIFEAIKQPHVLKEGQTPRFHARAIELRHGANIAEAAASVPGLQRILWSSLPSPKKWSQGRYSKVSMFDTKEDIYEILKSTPELQDKLSVLLVGFYATNALHVPDMYGPQRKADGGYELALPRSGDVAVPIADLDSDMGHWCHALFHTEPGTILVGATEVLTWKQWVDLWARANQVTARYRRATSSEYAAKIEGISDAVLEEFAFVEEYGFTGGNPQAVYPDELRKRGVSIPRSSVEEQIRNCDWSSIL